MKVGGPGLEMLTLVVEICDAEGIDLGLDCSIAGARRGTADGCDCRTPVDLSGKSGALRLSIITAVGEAFGEKAV